MCHPLQESKCHQPTGQTSSTAPPILGAREHVTVSSASSSSSSSSQQTAGAVDASTDQPPV